MKDSVCSWICVTAWKTETSRPTTRPASSSGRATFIASCIASMARLMTRSVVTGGSDSTSDRVTRFQPSTRTNSRILNGSEMKTGGSMIMPMLISVELTTRSITRNGRKIRKPIWNAVLSSEMMKAGIRT